MPSKPCRNVLNVYPSRIDQKIVTSVDEITPRSTRSASRNGTGGLFYAFDQYIGRTVSFTSGISSNTSLKQYTPDAPRPRKTRKYNKKGAGKQSKNEKKKKKKKKSPSLTTPSRTQMSDSYATSTPPRSHKRKQDPDWTPIAKRKRVRVESSSNYVPIISLSTNNEHEQEEDQYENVAAEQSPGSVEIENMEIPDDKKPGSPKVNVIEYSMRTASGDEEELNDRFSVNQKEEEEEIVAAGQSPGPAVDEILGIRDDRKPGSIEENAIDYSMRTSSGDEEESIDEFLVMEADINDVLQKDYKNKDENISADQSDVIVYHLESAAIEYNNFDYDKLKKQLMELPCFDHRDADLILPVLNLADRDTMIDVQNSDSEQLGAFYANELYPALLKYKQFLISPENVRDQNSEQFESYEMDGLLVEIPLNPRPEIFPHQERKRKERELEEELEEERLEQERMEEARREEDRREQQRQQILFNFPLLGNFAMGFPAAYNQMPAPIHPAMNLLNNANFFPLNIPAPQLNPLSYQQPMFPFPPELFQPLFNHPPQPQPPA